MRTLRLFVTIVIGLVCCSASAELIIYKGTLKQTGIGMGATRKIASRYYLIVDHDTANIAQVEYLTINDSKIFAAQTETNLHFVQMSAPNGKNNEAIAHAPNDCDVSEGNTSDGVFVQGTDGLLTVNSNSTVTFPKVMSGGGSSISYSSGPPIFISSSLVVSFDGPQTLTSNGNGETLDDALSRISSLLQSQGYSKTSERSKLSRQSIGLLEVLP